MGSQKSLQDIFEQTLLRKLETQRAPSWLANLEILKAELEKIEFGGIPHKAYWFDIQRNHLPLLIEILEEICPQLGPFKRTNLFFKENSYSKVNF